MVLLQRGPPTHLQRRCWWASGLSTHRESAKSVPATGAASASAMPAEAAEVPALESQDQLLEYCLLAGLRRVPTSELPCLTSDFYSKYMLPAKPAGAVPRHACLDIECTAQVRQHMYHVSWTAASVLWLPMCPCTSSVRSLDVLRPAILHLGAGANVDVKKSSYKKLSKLLTTFEKKVRALTHCICQLPPR